MVQAAIGQADTEVEVQFDDCYYHIDLAQYERDGASYEFMIWQRLCWEGSCTLCKNRTGPKPVMPVKMRNSKSIFAAIKQCAKQDNFILPKISTSEAVFRILLRNGNEPMRLSQIIDELVLSWEEVISLKTTNPASLQQMLDSENEYRINRTEAPAE